ncbi:hypothetical protein C0J52_02581 [Blattella germanica]|nr:hypothetical protein C0J52_02581 [Blattella germanica]
MVKWKTLFLIVCTATMANPAKILALFPYIGKSHFVFFEPYVKELANRGHEVVVVSHFPQKNPVPNLKDISLVGSLDVDATDRVDMDKLFGFKFLSTAYKELNQLSESCNKTLAFHAVQDLYRSKKHFDLVIVESFNTDCVLPVAHKFNAPIIGISSSTVFPWTDYRMGNPRNPAYVPSMFTTYSDKMSFSQRLKNAILEGIYLLSFSVADGVIVQNFVNQNFGENAPILSDIARNTSLVLLNTHFTLNRPRPLLPNVVEVGGLHIKPAKKLPKELEEYLDSAEHGVIYFSMGSMLRAETLPPEKRDAFLQAFAELPQKVIWKWEGDTMPGQPANVKIAKWLPQFDVLNHPNIRLYLSHGGLLGTIEAVYAGVPMVGIPMFGDQPVNVAALEAAGMGVSLDFQDITKETVLNSLKTVLNQPSFRENAKRMSKIYQDRPLSPMDTAIYWTEYVLRHKGAPHMRSAALDLSWYQYLLLDVIAVILIILLLILIIPLLMIKKMLSLFKTRNSKQPKKVKWNLFVLLLAFKTILVSPARILALFPFFGKSHFDVFNPYLRELASRGHQVLLVSHFPQNETVPNIEDISLVGVTDMEPINKIDLNKMSGFSFLQTTMNDLWQLIDSYNRSLAFHRIQELIKSKTSFDVVISETFATDFFTPFAKHFDAPLICVSSSIGFPWTDSRMGNPRNPAMVPTVYTSFTDKMGFRQRVLNLLLEGISHISYISLEKFWVQNYVNQYFDDKPNLSEIAKNTSLILMNTYFALHGSRPLLPNVVEELEEYLDSAEHGIIYFSMGSMIRAETLPPEKRDAFLQAFAELPQKVIWKWEGDTMPGKPPNVKIAKWLPQFDILSHPNIKVFISQGGVLSTLEAIYAGVPMVGIPLYGDQTINIAAIVTKGMGVQLDYNDISKDTVLAILKRVLDQPSYKENANRLSKIYQDRPLSAMDTAIYWTEYIIRHKGAPHLNSAAKDLNLFQYLLIDVIASIIIVVVIIITIQVVIIKKVLSIFKTLISIVEVKLKKT